MAPDLRKRLAAIASGRRRVRPLPTLGIALGVTALVAIPLTETVLESTNPSADADAIIVDTADDEPRPLDGAILVGDALISFNDADATGASFQLFGAESDVALLASQDLTGPNFFPVQDDDGVGQALDTEVLPNGDYELFVTVTVPAGEQRAAVVFEVANP